MAPVRAEKQKSTFSKFNNWILQKHRISKVFFDIKTEHFAYKPISDSLF